MEDQISKHSSYWPTSAKSSVPAMQWNKNVKSNSILIRILITLMSSYKSICIDFRQLTSSSYESHGWTAIWNSTIHQHPGYVQACSPSSLPSSCRRAIAYQCRYLYIYLYFIPSKMAELTLLDKHFQNLV